jgi:hypothetical protein
LAKVLNPVDGNISRPRVPDGQYHGEQEMVIEKMKACWDENPNARPTFRALRQFVKKLNRGWGASTYPKDDTTAVLSINRSINLMDNMLEKLEKYSSNLEDIIAQRTSDLVEEKKKTDTLLYRMLPQ